mgnify:CR=1 FL=1
MDERDYTAMNKGAENKKIKVEKGIHLAEKLLESEIISGVNKDKRIEVLKSEIQVLKIQIRHLCERLDLSSTALEGFAMEFNQESVVAKDNREMLTDLKYKP